MYELPEMPNPNWEEKLPLFWHYVKWFISINQVWIMIGVGLLLAMAVLTIIVSLFVKDEEKDYDYLEY